MSKDLDYEYEYEFWKYLDLPVEEVLVDSLYREEFLDGHDRKAVLRAKKLLRNGAYRPIIVSYVDIPETCGGVMVDGCHRVIAAHQLGMRTIRAKVER